MQTQIVRHKNFEEKLLEDLTNLWKESVIATHHFLKEEGMESLLPIVKKGIQEVDIVLLSYTDEVLSGFVAIQDHKIEMLFVLPLFLKKGIGRILISTAINEYEATSVDVNEQNEGALKFYNHIGFQTYERQELDDYGNPFPILKMKLKKNSID